MIRYTLLAVLLVLAMGCGREPMSSGSSKVGVALVQLPSGTIVRETCLKRAIDSGSNPTLVCENVEPNRSTIEESSGSSGGSRGVYGGSYYSPNWNSYYSNPNYQSYYYVINPWYYPRQNYCGSYSNSSGCYNYLYPGYDTNISIYVGWQRPGCSHSYGASYPSYNSCWQSHWWY